MSGNRSRILVDLASKICETDEDNARHESSGLYTQQLFVTNKSETNNFPIVSDSVNKFTTDTNENPKIASPLAEKQYEQYFHMAVDFENKENQKSPTIYETTGAEDERGPTFINNDVTISSEREKDSSSSSSSISTSSSSSSVFDNTSGDPNYSSNSSSSSSDDSSDEGPPLIWNQNLSNKRRSVKNPCPPPENVKKRKRKISQWQKNVAKMMRNSGQSYASIKITKNEDGTKDRVLVNRKARIMRPPCNADKCRYKCSLKLADEQRQKIFDDYWSMADLQKQRMYIASCTTTIKPRYRYTSSVKKIRGLNNAFFFTYAGEKIRVCKSFFMATLCINSQVIETVLRKQNNDVNGIIQADNRGRHQKHSSVPEELKEEVRNHIRSIPRMESHYCRSQSKKEYIEGGKTIADLHRDYEQHCKELEKPSVNYLMYSNIFKGEFNLSFFIPKKDKCDFCQGFINASELEKQELQEQYNNHIEDKELSRKEKDIDKHSPDKIVAVYDMQAALPCPQGDSSSFYYVSKLSVYNLTLYELKSTEAMCFMWHEGLAHRGANEVGSCVWAYLQSVNAKNTEMVDVVFYTDNCFGQNKNRFVFALYIHAVSVLENIRSITHKFLISGHTQNEGDHVHSIIERSITKFKKFSPIYVPDQYVTLVRQAKKNGNPFTVHEMCYENFFDLKQLSSDMGMKDSFKTEEGDSVPLSGICILKVTKENPSHLMYKMSYKQEEFNSLNVLQSKRRVPSPRDVTLKQAYRKKVGINEKKKAGLLSLFAKKKNVAVMPQYYRDFYANL